MSRNRSGSESTFVDSSDYTTRSRSLSTSSSDYAATLVDEHCVEDFGCLKDRSHYKKAGEPNKGFKNPWSSVKSKSWLAEIRDGPFIRKTHVDESISIEPLKSVQPSFEAVGEHEGMRITWLGHASVLLQLASGSTKPGPTILFDPVLSERASPFSFAGPKRTLPAPCSVHDLPHIDFVCLSHNHYDHFDSRTICDLVNRLGGERTQFLVPLGNRLALVKAGVQLKNIHEMDWWQSFSPASKHGNFSSNPPSYKAALITESDLRIVCTPAQHGSARTPFDRNGSLWSSWVVQYSTSQGGAHSFFFGGSVSIDRATCRVAADG